MKIYYCNVRSIRNKLGPEFSEILANYDIVLLSETFLKSVDIICFSNFRTIRCDRANDTGYGGVLILIKKTLDFEEFEIKNYKKIESAFVELNDPQGRKLRLRVVYNPPNCDQEVFSELTDLFSKVLSDKTPCILVGDFNFPKIN